MHDRATRSESLSSEEQSLLEEWYAFQDGIGHAALSVTTNEKNLVALHTQIEILLTQLTTVTKRIQEISIENNARKQEVARLHRRLQGAVQPAG